MKIAACGARARSRWAGVWPVDAGEFLKKS